MTYTTLGVIIDTGYTTLLHNFGEDMSNNRRNIVIKTKTWEKLRRISTSEERSMSDIIRQALHEFFTRREQNKVGVYDPAKDKITHRRI